jgi:hypothetical protein
MPQTPSASFLPSVAQRFFDGPLSAPFVACFALLTTIALNASRLPPSQLVPDRVVGVDPRLDPPGAGRPAGEDALLQREQERIEVDGPVAAGRVVTRVDVAVAAHDGDDAGLLVGVEHLLAQQRDDLLDVLLDEAAVERPELHGAGDRPVAMAALERQDPRVLRAQPGVTRPRRAFRGRRHAPGMRRPSARHPSGAIQPNSRFGRAVFWANVNGGGFGRGEVPKRQTRCRP